jgi:hypothetical protein
MARRDVGEPCGACGEVLYGDAVTMRLRKGK